MSNPSLLRPAVTGGGLLHLMINRALSRGAERVACTLQCWLLGVIDIVSSRERIIIQSVPLHGQPLSSIIYLLEVNTNLPSTINYLGDI